MHVNRMVIVSVAGITGVTVLRIMGQNMAALKTGAPFQPFTPTLVGGFSVLLLCAIADLFGGAASQLVGGLAFVALFYVVLTQFPWFLFFPQLPPALAGSGGGGVKK